MKIANAIEGFSLAGTPRRHKLLRPDAPALIFEDRTLTYGEFDDECSRAANAFQAAGIALGPVAALPG